MDGVAAAFHGIQFFIQEVVGWEDKLPQKQVCSPEGLDAGNAAEFMGQSLFYETFGQMQAGKSSGLDLNEGVENSTVFFLIFMAASEKDTIKPNYGTAVPAPRTVPGPGRLRKHWLDE